MRAVTGEHTRHATPQIATAPDHNQLYRLFGMLFGCFTAVSTVQRCVTPTGWLAAAQLSSMLAEGSSMDSSLSSLSLYLGPVVIRELHLRVCLLRDLALSWLGRSASRA